MEDLLMVGFSIPDKSNKYNNDLPVMMVSRKTGDKIEIINGISGNEVLHLYKELSGNRTE